MFTEKDVKNILYVDVETVSEHDSLSDLIECNPKKADAWIKRCEFLRRRYIDNANASDEELYMDKAALQAEFAKIVCVSVGMIDDDMGAKVISFANDEEREMLTRFMKLCGRYFDKAYASGRICGHNIKRFDVPMLAKRSCMCGVRMEHPFNGLHRLKPWEMPFLDTAEVWGFGAWQETFAGLDLLAMTLGLESSKGNMSGDKVGEAYRDGRLDDITRYCEDDVIVTMNLLLRLGGMDALAFDAVSRHNGMR